MDKNVVRIIDYERRSREPDAEGPRAPDEPCSVIVLPVIRIERLDIRSASGSK
jgi:hypothetical protein